MTSAHWVCCCKPEPPPPPPGECNLNQCEAIVSTITGTWTGFVGSCCDTFTGVQTVLNKNPDNPPSFCSWHWGGPQDLQPIGCPFPNNLGAVSIVQFSLQLNAWEAQGIMTRSGGSIVHFYSKDCIDSNDDPFGIYTYISSSPPSCLPIEGGEGQIEITP